MGGMCHVEPDKRMDKKHSLHLFHMEQFMPLAALFAKEGAV
jgi:hypothetical protein